MRFFGAPSVLLALGVSAVAGHSYHAFGNGYQSVVKYGGLPATHKGHSAHSYATASKAPVFHEDFHLNDGFVTYMEQHGQHNGIENHDDHSHHELHDLGHHDHYEHHENYVIHDNNNHLVEHDHKEEHKHHDKDDHHHHHHHEHHEHHENYVVHDDHYNHSHKEDHRHHDNHDHHEKHEEDDNDFEEHDHSSEEHNHSTEEHNHSSEEHNHSTEEHNRSSEEDDHDHKDHDEKHKSAAKYEFQYGVNDPKTGDVKEHWESRTGDNVRGRYSLLEADGTTRVVHYSADNKKGFQATVHKIGHPNERHSVHSHRSHH